MDADEREIFYFLKSERANFVPANSIGRHAGGKNRHRESPEWAKPVLLRMAERGILELGPAGAFRLKPMPVVDPNTRRWVSPQIAEMLRKSGKQFEAVMQQPDNEEAYYDSL